MDITNNYKISIIVPVYNKEKYLADCLDSLTGQTYDNLEIILVDDGSTDSSGALCDEYAHKDGRITVIHKENSGAAGAWRAGLKAADGKYILFVDSDDWIEADMAAVMASYVTGRDDEIISCDYCIEKENGSRQNIFQALPPGEYTRKQMTEYVIPNLWGHEDRMLSTSRCMKLFAAGLVRDNEHYSRSGLKFGEDNALMLPCMMDCGRLVVLDHKTFYHYRYVTGSVVHGYDTTLISSITFLQKLTAEMIADKFEKCKEADIPADYAEMLSNRIWLEWPYLLIYAVKNEIRGGTDYIKKIRQICLDPDNREKILNPKIQVTHTNNRLIFAVMKHPSALRCFVLRRLMTIWDNR